MSATFLPPAESTSQNIAQASGQPVFVDQPDPPFFMLDEKGFIQKCNSACAELFGCQGPDLARHHISCFFPQLSGQSLVTDGQLNPMLDFLCHCGHRFQALNAHGGTFNSTLNLIRIRGGGASALRLIVQPCPGA